MSTNSPYYYKPKYRMPILNEVIKIFKEYQTKYKSQKAAQLGVPDTYEFDVDDPDYTDYVFTDLRLHEFQDKRVISLEICEQISSISNMNCLLIDPVYVNERENLSRDIETFISTTPEIDEKFNFHTLKIIPKPNDMILVKWEFWNLVKNLLHNIKDKDIKKILTGRWYKIYTDAKEHKYQGKWYRAHFDRTIDGCDPSDPDKPLLCRVYLVDLGKRIVVPYKYMYKLTCRFMLPMQYVVQIGFFLDHEAHLQYNRDANDKFSKVLPPGMKIKVQVISGAGDTTCVRLVEPTETWCNEEYDRYLMECEKKELAEIRKQITDYLMKRLESSPNLVAKDLQAELNIMKERFITKKQQEDVVKKYSMLGMEPFEESRQVGAYLNSKTTVL